MRPTNDAACSRPRMALAIFFPLIPDAGVCPDRHRKKGCGRYG
jgi:hypothetical protein